MPPLSMVAAASCSCILSSVGHKPLFSFSRWLTRIEQGHINKQFLEISTTQEDQKKGRKVQTPRVQIKNNQTASGKDSVNKAFSG